MPTRRPRRAPRGAAQPPQAPATSRRRAGPTPQPGTRAPARQAPPDESRRVNRGYKLRADLAKACKRLAVEEERPLYEIMEEALEMYLAHKAKGSR